MAEIFTINKEFERKPNSEVEKKYLPLFPEQLDFAREFAIPIEQVYLSHPSEPYNLRLRQTEKEGQAVFLATLKDSGAVTPDGLERLEIETEISQSAYEYYHSSNLPIIKKLRSSISYGVTIDWFEDGYMHLESEIPNGLDILADQYDIHKSHFVDITGDKQADNEWRAHFLFKRSNNGTEALSPPAELNLNTVVETILYSQENTTAIRINGRSGSGKSTIVTRLQQKLLEHGLDSVVVSTDDYNKGKRYLSAQKGAPWTDWDDPITYDTKEAAKDIEKLLRGLAVAKQRFDFKSEEPVIEGVIEPAKVIIIEGICAQSPELARIAPLSFKVPTPFATSVGWRLMRDYFQRNRINNSLPTPEAGLRYILEKAEPAYRAQVT